MKTLLVQADATKKWRSEMWSLYEKYYDVDPNSFYKRFESNDFYALYAKNDELVGFTGFRKKTIHNRFGRIKTLYFGQTVIRQDFRGRSLIPITVIRVILHHFLTDPFCPLYVWCDALTYKPYLLFANSLKEFYPSRHQENADKVEAVITELGQYYYRENFNSTTGTVCKPKNVIQDTSAIISEKDKAHPDIAFYAKANPGYNRGHGLLTLAPMNLKNFLFLIKKCLIKKYGR